jgi:signal transduction histidine kinase/CHASE2 domain-containing sensor protein
MTGSASFVRWRVSSALGRSARRPRFRALWPGSLQLWLAHGLAYLAVAVAYLWGATIPLEQGLLELQYRLFPHDATGTLAVVEIDSRSLKLLDTWPWPRSYHATLVDRLVASGVRAIAYDVDFSSHSTPEGDAQLASAIERADGRVILPVFKQRTSATDKSGESYSAPIEAFQANARLASVTIQPRSDGRIWLGRAADLWNGLRLPSIAGLLAGRQTWQREPFLIDYGIRPETIPHISFADVMNGRFDATALAGKSVIVGGTAVELGDYYPVPVHGQLPGVFIQALAYESLAQNRAVALVPPPVILLITFLISVPAGYWFRRLSWQRAGAIAVIASGAVIAGSLAAKSYGLLYTEVAPAILAIAVAYVVSVARELNELAQRILMEHMKVVHQRVLMKSAVQSSFDGIVVADDGGAIHMLNPAAAAMFGCDLDTCIGQQIQTIIPMQQPAQRSAIGAPDPAPDPLHFGTTAPVDITFAKPGSEPIEVEVIVSKAVVDPDHPLTSKCTPGLVYVYTIHDITQRKRTEDAERRAKDEAVASGRAKTEFLANMSHELRTPLNAVIGFSEILCAEMLGPLGSKPYLEYAKDIHQSGTHLLNIINDILDVSQIELGKLRFTEESVDLAGTISSAVRVVSLRLQEKKIQIEVMIEDDLPLLWADERAVKQVLLNLLSNAGKFTDRDGRVTVSARLEASNEISITVSDNGIGMSQEVAANATQAFYQADRSPHRSHDGTGLGLSIVQGLMKLHGGAVMIESTPAVGSKVTLRFPQERSQRRAPSLIHAASSPPAPS